jgi:RNA recognition motif-containing protein
MLREFTSQDEIANFQNALYDFNTDVAEEGYVAPVSEIAEDEEKIDEKETSEEEEEDMAVKSTLEKVRTDEEEE